jgi:predicted lipoprotein
MTTPRSRTHQRRRALLKHLGEDVILRSYQRFVERAGALRLALEAYAEEQTPATREAAQEAFRAALLSWERAELYQVGPAAEVSNFSPGAGGLRAEIYSFRDANPCVVDRGLVSQTYLSKGFADDVYAYARDLSAIERLLFSSSNESACPASDRVVTEVAWQALVAGDLTQRRALYAARAGEAVEAKAKQLVKAFEEEFLPELAQAGDGSKLFDRTQEALDALTSALFYVDFDIRELKLAGPLGQTMDCASKVCPTELPYAKLSKQALTENLLALRAVFQGHLPEDEASGEGLRGLNDLLASVDAEPLAQSIDDAIAAALDAVDAVEPSFEDTPRSEDGALFKALEAVQALCDLLKTEFLQKLALSTPMRATGDND